MFDKNAFWLGATDAHQQGLWMWDSGAEVTLNHWEPNQPDNNGGNCMVVNTYYDTWEWDDQDCAIPYKSVCEIDLNYS